MAELVAVQSGLALYRSGEVGVIIDTQDLNPYDPQPLKAILASGEWDTSVPTGRVPTVCQELADVALEGVQPDVSLVASSANDGRIVRVPKKVQDAVRQGLETLRNDERAVVPLAASGAAQRLLTGTVTVGQVKKMHARMNMRATGTKNIRTLYGGDAGLEWTAKVCNEYGVPLTAAGPPVAAPAPSYAEDPETQTDWTDPTKPHVYVELAPGDTTCALCEHPESDPIHVPEAQAAPTVEVPDSGSTVEYFATFVPGGDEAPTFRVDSVLARDEDNSWWLRELGEWSPHQAPDADTNLLQLDLESFQAAVEQLDDPSNSVAELSISEAKLFQFAANELDYDQLDAVFAAAPYVPPEVRSKNASAQLRDSKGRFIVQGGAVKDSSGHRGTVARIDKNTGMVDIKGEDGQIKTVRANEVTNDADGDGVPDATPAPEAAAPPAAASGEVKARLSEPAQLVPDVQALVAQYQERWKQEKGEQEAAAPVEPPVTAAGDPLIPPAEAPPASPSPTAAGPSTPVTQPGAPAAPVGGDPVAASGVTPLYLAQVDPNDVQAVLELLAVIPSTGAGDAVDVFQRDDGQWVPAPEIHQAIMGPTPPPVVELNADMLANVLSQMDVKRAPGPGDPAPAGPVPVAASAGYALIQRHVLTASGHLALEYSQGPRLLKPYRDGVFPADIRSRLSQFAEGGADQNRGNAERLRRYWTKGEGAAKIRWGTDGDWTRCVKELSEHLGPRAKGYCTLRHKDALGYYPGELDRPGNPKSGEGRRRAFQVEDASVFGITSPEVPTEAEVDAEIDSPHEAAGTGDTCEVCDRPAEHPLHTPPAPMNGEFRADSVPDTQVVGVEGRDVTDVVDFEQPHPFIPSTLEGAEPGECECGRPENDRMHEATVVASGIAALADTAEEVEAGQKFRIPLVVPEGVESGDGRTFAKDALSSRDMPLALMWQPEGDEGHKGSVIVGRIDHVERTEQGLGNAYGVFDTGQHGQEALRLVRAGMLRGISADLDEFEADVLTSGEDDKKVSATKLLVNSGRLMGITLVAKPAYAECTIELVNEGENPVADGEYEADSGEVRVASLIASAAPLNPPKDWFQNPGLDKPTHLTVDDEGRVFGHIAAWDVDHIGLPFGTRAPRSASNYAYFRTGVIRTAEGDDVPVGQLTLAGGHAPLQADARMAVKHYDDTASAVADLAAGEDAHGIWVSGALRPGVTPEQVRALRASSPSGDWRPIKNKLELVAVCQVNVPGFPVARAMVSSGQVTALVAAGAIALEAPEAKAPVDQVTDNDINARIAALEEAEKRRLEAAAFAIRQRMAPAISARQNALTAAALQARERINRVREEKRQVLEAQKAALSARVASANGVGFRVMPEFEEDEHPRDNKGRFREVLGRLEDLLGSETAGQAGLQRMQDAAAKAEAGDPEGAKRAAQEAEGKLHQAAEAAPSPEKAARLEEAAQEVAEVVERTAKGDLPGEEVVDDATPPEPTNEDSALGEILFEQLTEAQKEVIVEAVSRAEAQLNPGDVDDMVQKMKAFITATNPMDPNDVANFVKNQLKRPFTIEMPNPLPQPPSVQPSVPSPV